MMKRPSEVKKENKDRWLLTYSDLITLLMVFFVVLYALSSVDVKKYQAVALSLSAAMGGGQSVFNDPGASLAPGISGSDVINLDEAGSEFEEQNEMEQIKKELEVYIEQNGLSGSITVTTEERGLVVSFQDAALFPIGSAELMTDAKGKINGIGTILIQVPNFIRVEGHTDNLPIKTSIFPSNWELSSARATSVVHELIYAVDFAPSRLSATGYGEYRPRAANDSEEQRQRNRRVDIVVLRNKYETAEPVSQLPSLLDVGNRL